MANSLTKKLISQYCDEAKEHINRISWGILSLENKGYDAEELETLYRHTHSLKGISKAVGLDEIVTISHQLEDIFEEIKTGKMPISEITVNLLLDYSDFLSESVESFAVPGKKALSKSTVEEKLKMLAKRLDEIEKHKYEEISAAEAYIFKVLTGYQEEYFIKRRKEGEKGYEITVFLKKKEYPEKLEFVKKSLNTTGEVIAITGSAEPVPKGFYLAFSLLYLSEKSLREIESLMNDTRFMIRKITGLPEQKKAGKTGTEDNETEKRDKDEPEEYDEKFLELRKSFIEESLDELINVTPNIIMLESESGNAEVVNGIFRTFHSLKGGGGTFKLFRITEVAHELETIMDRMRKGKLEVSPAVIDLLLEGIDCLSNILTDAQKGCFDETAKFPLIEKIKQFLLRDEAAAEDKGSKRSDSGIDTGRRKTQPEKTAQTGKSETIRVSLEKLDHLVNVFGELILFKNVEEYNEKSMEKLKKLVKNNFRQFRKSREKHLLNIQTSDSNGNADLKLFLDDLDGKWKEIESFLMDLCRNFQDNISRGRFLIEELQEEILKIRMLPVSTILNQYHRLVRDISQKNGKKVILNITGGEIELDKWILEEINDPLIHLIRNSVDHGIETPEERKNTGKSEEGTITLSVTQKGNHVVIEVSDDGCGIDTEKIKDSVIRKNFAGAEQLKKLSPQEILQFIFQPGFSTSKEVTDISGRGVGLDVVKTNLKKINGMIDLITEKEKGTTFYLRVPLTMAIRKAILIKEGDRIFAVTTEAIEEVYLMRHSEIEIFEGAMTLKHRDSTIPLIRLAQEMNISGRNVLRENVPVIIVGSAEEKIGILVEEILSEKEIVVKNFGTLLGKIPKFSGTAVLPDGEIALVMDISSLVDMVAGGHIKMKSQPLSEKTRAEKIRILLAEDSALARNLFKGILETRNYEVLTAVDGNDALNVLKKNRVDLIITDIIMPGLDGYGLISKLKADPKYRKLPVIIVSGKGKEEEKIKGLECGADAYIVKSKFERQKLIDIIENLI